MNEAIAIILLIIALICPIVGYKMLRRRQSKKWLFIGVSCILLILAISLMLMFNGLFIV
ncbi:hypothetical protein [Peribacillus acanthi]|uniref:hypothetical protein n=1 Tax=Peribacillus acanthi TaxID=2171554 RepID=UPI001300282B|nr:hypothetical protein [Peribacillus acanthi]